MATKSILKNVRIKDKRAAYALVKALENASKRPVKEVKLSRPCRELNDEEIREIFGGAHG